jgi:uncharacterized protein YjiS (DUF1127 family)
MRNDPKTSEKAPQLTNDDGPRNDTKRIPAFLWRTVAIVRDHRRRHAASRELRHLSASLRMDLGLQPDDRTRRFD